MKRATRLAVSIGVVAALMLSSPFWSRTDPIRRFLRFVQTDDMRRQLDAMPTPEDFRQIGISVAPLPAIDYFYAATARGQALCDQLFKFARAVGEPKAWPGDSCGLSTEIPSGWRARLINVWSYELRIFGLPDSQPATRPTDPICVRELAEALPLESRMAPCWLGPNESYVDIMLFGRSTLP